MEIYQFWTIVGMMAAGFGWLIHQNNQLKDRLASLENRMSIVETILTMLGYPTKMQK